MIKISGLYTALLTPFDANGKIDFVSLIKLIHHQAAAKVDGLVLFGSTGESATVSFDERAEVIMTVSKSLSGLGLENKIQLVVGTGHNSTDETIKLTSQAKSLGADAAMIVLPFYNRPSQEGIYQHFSKIHDHVDIPIIIYNVPTRTSCTINNDTVARLSKKRNIVGIKDSSCNLANPVIVSSLIEKQQKDKGEVGENGDKVNINEQCQFTQLSGEDCTALAFNAHGGKGCISVAGNIMPAECKRIQDLSLIHNDYSAALEVQRAISPLNESLYCDTNPIPLKYAAYRMGLIKEPTVRLPLCGLSQVNMEKVDGALRAVGLLQ